jgi:hypothetical protein
MKCPRCKTGLVVEDRTEYTGTAARCITCGAYHVYGSNRESIDRQMTGRDPESTMKRAAFGERG